MSRKIVKIILCLVLIAAVVGGAVAYRVHEARYAELCGVEIDVRSEELNLWGLPYTVEELLALSTRMENVTALELGQIEMNAEELAQICAAYPYAEVHYTVEQLGETFTPDTKELDLSQIDPQTALGILPKMQLLPQLHHINLIDESGKCRWGLSDISVLDTLRKGLPNVQFCVQFDLFGQTVSSEDTRIEYVLTDIGNDGAETIRSVLPYLTACEYLLLDGCGIDNEVLAQLREDFPQTKIVWRIWLGEPAYNSPRSMRARSFLTDTHRIRTTAVNDGNCHLLQYCVETKYVDFGHNHGISDFSFLSYMPKLEVAILALTKCHDLTPLASCPELEYLEIYRSDVTDLSPLANCKKLKHLNFGDMDISDITCLYDIDLERIRGCVTPVPKEQWEEFARLHPNCQILNEGGSPSKNGWRKDAAGVKVPRYALLQQQMEYAIDHQYGIA
ncbi:MAG: hypothetical protein IJA67_08855 [Oscillospiraceae bacterium]|nr:hypothetical protein [Oscillospiraceae bacterium]